MKIIVGLGNPGTKYKKTYHNLGFIAAEDAAILLNAKFNKKECDAVVAETFIGGERVIIAKPQTYMNLSGLSVKSLLSKYKASAEDLVVIYDDYDIPLGKLRVRAEGSAGSHNGMKSIISEINSNNFFRIRIGINSGDTDIPLINYVLKNIDKAHYNELAASVKNAAECATFLAGGGTEEAAMQRFNTNN